MSAIDSKPIYPPYLKLADFDTYLANEAQGQSQDKKKGEGASSSEKAGGGGGKDEAATMVASSKQKRGADEGVDYKLEMEEFKETIGELYYEKAVKLMEEIEEKRREDERAIIKLQTSGNFKKSTIRNKEKTEHDA